MNFRTHNDGPIDVSDTQLQGSIQSTRADLWRVFGSPEQVGSEGDRVTLEWAVQFADGLVATIYDWKTANCERDSKALVSWNIGGKTRDAAERIHEAYRAGHSISTVRRVA